MTLATERERVFTLKSIEIQRKAADEYKKAHPVIAYIPSSRRQEIQESMSDSDENESVSKPMPQDQTRSAFSASNLSFRQDSAQTPV